MSLTISSTSSRLFGKYAWPPVISANFIRSSLACFDGGFLNSPPRWSSSSSRPIAYSVTFDWRSDFDDFIDAVLAGVVFAVADQQQRFLVFLAFLRDFVRRKIQSIVQSGFAASIDVFERVDQIADAAGEILFEISRIVEIDNERFILGIAFAHERQRRAVHALAFVAHAAAVVDDQAKADRNVFVPERLDRLQNFVFENLEVFLFQAVDRTAFFIENGYRQLDFKRLDAEGVILVLAPVSAVARGPARAEQRK